MTSSLSMFIPIIYKVLRKWAFKRKRFLSPSQVVSLSGISETTNSNNEQIGCYNALQMFKCP